MTYGTCCVDPSGRYHSGQSNAGTGVTFDGQTLPTDEGVLFPRSAHDGVVGAVVSQGGTTGQCNVVLTNGQAFVASATTNGVQPGGIVALGSGQGFQIVCVCDAGRTLSVNLVPASAGNDWYGLTVGLYQPLPADVFGTSQGLLNVTAGPIYGVPVFTQRFLPPAAPVVIDGVTFALPMTTPNGWTIGQDQHSLQTVVAKPDGTVWALGAWSTPLPPQVASASATSARFALSGNAAPLLTDADLTPYVPPSPPPPSFGPFLFPLSIAPFKDVTTPTAADSEIVVDQTPQTTTRPCWVATDSVAVARGPIVGYFTSDWTYVPPATVRVAWCQDNAAPVVLPPHARPWDSMWLECYLVTGDTPASAVARWTATLDALLAAWPGDVGIVAMFYLQGGAPPWTWTVAQVEAVMPALTPLANRSPHVKVIAPFAHDRVNGMTGVPPLLIDCATLVTASGTARPTFTPIPIPEVPMLIGYSRTPYAESTTPVLDQVATVVPAGVGAGLSNPTNPPATPIESVQPDGTWQTRAGTPGPFETFYGITATGCLMAICPNAGGAFGAPPYKTYVYPYRVIG